MARAAAAAPPKKRRGRKAPPSPPSPKPFWRSHARWLVALVVVVAVGLAARLVIRPAVDPVGTPDAVVVLASGGDAALEEGIALLNAEITPVLVLPGGIDASRPAANRLCADPAPGAVLCPVVVGPTDGRGEARAVATLAAERGWQRVAVITSRQELSRSALLLRRCTPATVVRRAVDVETGPATGVAEVGRYLVALGLRRGC